MKLTASEEKVIKAIRGSTDSEKAANEAYLAALKVVVKEAVIDVLGNTQLGYTHTKPPKANKR